MSYRYIFYECICVCIVLVESFIAGVFGCFLLFQPWTMKKQQQHFWLFELCRFWNTKYIHLEYRTVTNIISDKNNYNNKLFTKKVKPWYVHSERVQLKIGDGWSVKKWNVFSCVKDTWNPNSHTQIHVC